MLRPTTILALFLLLCGTAVSQTTTTANFVPTVPATVSGSTPTAVGGNNSSSSGSSCPLRYHDCSVIGKPYACCSLDQVCINDDAGQTACCPFRTRCIGTLNTSGAPTTVGLMLEFKTFLVAGAASVATIVFWIRGYHGS